ncbi:MAG: trypsin-like peptidase domain-containing protein [Pirellulaceae bacterium]|nr:trypsin-like peptidase domain-containing protein [Pirellulaceae bacterium]
MSKLRILRELLLDVFAGQADLELFVQDYYEPLYQAISFGDPPRVIAQNVAKQLEARGCVTGQLFDHLAESVPGREATIRQVQQRLGVGSAVTEPPASASSPPSASSATASHVSTPALPSDSPVSGKPNEPAGAGPWWNKAPIAWQEPEPQSLLAVLVDAYPRKDELIAVAQNVGLHEADIDTDGTPRQVARRIIQLAAAMAALGCLIDEALSDHRVAAFHERIRGLVVGDLRREVAVARLCRTGEFQPRDSQWLASLGATVPPGDEALVTEGLQSIVDAQRGLGDPLAFVMVVTNAMRRTAMLELDGHPDGTGFLVGARHLLTCAHVVGVLRSPPPPDLVVTAVFDFYAGGRVAHSEHGRRVQGKVVAWSYPAPAETSGQVSDWNAASDQLDYALIELERPVGDEPAGPLAMLQSDRFPRRGFFPLTATRYDFSRASLLLVTQHPLGERIAISHGTPPFTENAHRTRVRYNANTLTGSSGSSVIDHRGRLVALHHYSARGVNQGVPIHAVAARLRTTHPRLVRDGRLEW